METITTTEQLIEVVKHTLHPYGLVHVDQVIAWLNKQADITRAECLEAEWTNGKQEDDGMYGTPYSFAIVNETDLVRNWDEYR